MNPWSNIEVSRQDPEIRIINRLEKRLGSIPVPVRRIRELISGFEVCHFKFRRHLDLIRDSIRTLVPYKELEKIGAPHIRHGEASSNLDKTGRSRLGWEYISAIRCWLGESCQQKEEEKSRRKSRQEVARWLEQKTREKERLVRLLISRLTWDWEAYESFKEENRNQKLEYQVCRMDICHYDFPHNLKRLLKGLGKMVPVSRFEGCGSFNSDIKKVAEDQLSELSLLLEKLASEKPLERESLIRAWLNACLAKTLKEQVASGRSLLKIIRQGLHSYG